MSDKRIAIYTDHSQANVELAALTALNKWEFSAIHEYHLITQRVPWEQEKRGYRIRWVKEHLGRDFDHVLWVGSDVVFTNPKRPIEMLIDDSYGVVLSESNGTGYPLCDDIALWHNNHAAHYVLNALLDRVIEAQHERYLFQSLMAKLCGLLDGPADPLFKQAVKILPQREMNSLPHRDLVGSWQHGDFVCHCCTGDLPNKINNVKTILSCLQTGAVPVKREQGQEGKG